MGPPAATSARGGSRTLQHLRDLPPLVQDALLVAVVLLVQLVALAGSTPDRLPPGVDPRPVDLGAFVLVIAATVPLLARRRWPYVAVGVPLASLLAFAAFDYGGIFGGYALLAALYSVVVYRGLRPGVIAAVITLGGLLAAYWLSSWDPAAPENVFDLLAIATAVALGDGTRNRMAATREQEARVAELAAAQAQLSRQVVMAERSRIARELHDLVAHSMSIVAVQAGVGHHLIDRDPAKAKEALAIIETTSRQALTEMRRMLGVLRTDDEAAAVSLDPQPGSSDITALVEQVRQQGVDVELVVHSDGVEPEQVPSGVALSAYRIVQEALTNVMKHAGQASVTVTLRYAPDLLTVTVDDDGRGMSTLGGSGSGYGLVGMRERAAVVGGELSTGPRPGGGYRVTAKLPSREGAA